MKRIVALVLALLLCLCCSAWAEAGVNVEVIKADGVSVVALTPVSTLRRARSIAAEKQPGFTLPQYLTVIEDGAFEGIAAEKVEITENVVSIGSRAFADCPNLREITIPASVAEIDADALAGCEGVTVYGSTDAAKAFAKANGFAFVDPNAKIPVPHVEEDPPARMPYVPAD